MHYIPCACGRYTVAPNVLSCPFCHKSLYSENEDVIRKHIRACSGKINPRVYSDHKCGRPRKEQMEMFAAEQYIRLDLFKRSCRSCGTRCQGCESGSCENWSRKRVKECPFCSNFPTVLSEGEKVLSIRCARCNLEMKVSDGVDASEALVSRWNRD